MKENFENDQIPLTKQEIVEEIITNNYYLVEAMRNDNKLEVQKRQLLIDNLIKIYLR